MPRKHNSSASQHAEAEDAGERRFAAAVEALLRAKARVPLAPGTGAETWTESEVLTRLAEIANRESEPEQLTDNE